MNKSAYWLCIICNVVCIVCWTLLAILFNKWWIALFMILCLSYPKLVTKHYRQCDVCGDRSTGADTPAEALSVAEKEGWLHIVDDNKDYCPRCRKKL